MDRSIKCLMIGQAGVGKSTFLRKFPNAKKLAVHIPSSTTATTTKNSTMMTTDTSPSKSNKTTTATTTEWKESYSIEFMNSRFETVRIDLDNCDISLDTCLHSSIIMMPPMNSSSVVNQFDSGKFATTIRDEEVKEAAEVTQRHDDEASFTVSPSLSSPPPSVPPPLPQVPLPISMLPINSCKFIDISAYSVIILCFSLDDAHSLELIKSKWEIDMKKSRAQHSFMLVGFKSDLVFQEDSEATTKYDQVV